MKVKTYLIKRTHFTVLMLLFLVVSVVSAQETSKVPEKHPRLLGSKEQLQKLAKERPEAYRRMADFARTWEGKGGNYEKMLSKALVCAIEDDAELGKSAIALAMELVEAPIRKGHVFFGGDLAYTALVYDLCYPYWSEAERLQYHQYMNSTIDANVKSETQVFHNGWYSYKHWGIGLSCYATYHENELAPSYLQTMEKDYRERAAPALELAGNGGGWGEGYYVNYFSYAWMFFCHVAKVCGGQDYFATAPSFYKNRAVASMFEAYPGIKENNTHQPIPMGDGGGRIFGSDRDKLLSARRILVNHFRDDPAHQVVHTFNERTPQAGNVIHTYMDFLWRDTTIPKGNLNAFKLSHMSPGPGYVYARSSWDDDATYFYFKCGDRFTSHQHLDVGHFLVYKFEELIGDGGHYDSFGSLHDVNYHLRTIAHNSMLIYNPEEKWPKIRAGNVMANDGGQAHNFPHHNGAVGDAQQWMRDKHLYDIGDIVAFEDKGEYLYVAGDCSRAYAPEKMDYFTRQIVYMRPGTFVIFDRVKSDKPEYKKTLLLQAMKPPMQEKQHFVLTNGKGKLYIQNIMPDKITVNLVNEENLYRDNGNEYIPTRKTGPAPECRMEISPVNKSQTDYFLTVLHATDTGATSVSKATVKEKGDLVIVSVEGKEISFNKTKVDMKL